MWPMGLLFFRTSPVKQYSYENDFSGVFDALHQSFRVIISEWSRGWDVVFILLLGYTVLLISFFLMANEGCNIFWYLCAILRQVVLFFRSGYNFQKRNTIRTLIRVYYLFRTFILEVLLEMLFES